MDMAGSQGKWMGAEGKMGKEKEQYLV